MNARSADRDEAEAEGLDQWSNTIGDDDDLDALWAALLTATNAAGPKDLEASLAQYLATLGARSRRTTEGLILAVIAATAAEGPAWEDWRVVLNRHFARDERIELGIAAAILLEWRKEERAPDWHSLPDRVTERVFRSYIQDMRSLIDLLDKPEEAARWEKNAKARNAAIHHYLWREKDGVFADYDFVHHKSSDYAYISSLYPLWAGVATREEAKRVVDKLSLFERPGGLSMSNFNSGLQWDEPFGWAPTNWVAIDGLNRMGFREDARRLAEKFCNTIDVGFAHDGTIREKFNVVNGNSDVQVKTGYKSNEIGFGWSKAVYRKLKEILKEGT